MKGKKPDFAPQPQKTRRHQMRTRSVLVPVVLFLAFLAGGCASASLRPSGPEPFLGEFQGVWTSFTYQSSGGVYLVVRENSDKSLTLDVNLTNSRFSSWSAIARLKDGMLVVDRPSLYMEFRLYEGGRIEATYDVPNRDRGIWSLTKKK